MKTQLIKCTNCETALASIDAATGNVYPIKQKKTTDDDLSSVQADSFKLSDGKNITCQCGTVNNIS